MMTQVKDHPMQGLLAPRRVRALTMAVGLGILLTGCGGETDGGGEEGQELVTVRAAVPNVTSFAPVFVAESRGYYADEGIELVIEPVQAGQDAIALLSNGQLDVGVAGFSAGMFNAIDSGLGLRVVGSMNTFPEEIPPEGPPNALMIRSDLMGEDGAVDVAGLAGSSIAVGGGEGAAGAYSADVQLRQHGLSLTDMTVEDLSFGDMQAAMETGAVDLALASAPFPTAMEDAGVAKVLSTPPPGHGITGILYGEHFVDTEAAVGFFTATARAADDLMNEGKTDEIVETIATGIDLDEETVRESPMWAYSPGLGVDEEQLTDMESVFQTLGVLDYDGSVASEAIDVTFSESALDTLDLGN